MVTNMVSDEKIREALDTLNSAALDQKEELRDLIDQSYSNIKDFFEIGENRFSSTMKQGEDKLKHAMSGIDRRLHEKPYPLMTSIAIGSLLLGFILGGTGVRPRD